MSAKQFTSFLQSFHVRFTAATVGAMLVIFLLGFFLIFQYAINAQFQAIRNRLMVIARTASLMVDADLFDQVPLRPDGVQSPAYRAIAANLRKIKAANPNIAYIYTMKKTAEPGILQFVVDPDTIEEREDKVLVSYPGTSYDAGPYPELLKGFDGPSADHALTVDEWGTLLSGYAPIVNGDGVTLGVLGVDMRADDVRTLEQHVYRRGAGVFILGLLLSVVMGLVLSRRITSPLKKLSDGTRQIAQERLDHRVEVECDDEIGNLARSFNTMARKLESSRKHLLNYFYDVVRSLVKALEFRDDYTRGHSEAVAQDAAGVARKLGYSDDVVEMVKKIALLHDIGKIGISDEILNKKGPLTPEEWEMIKAHPVQGEEILRPVILDPEMIAVVRSHHERHDGKGYPDQLPPAEIHQFAAIVTVVDAYDAMVSKRSYKEPMTPQQAVDELVRHSGTQFHPDVVQVFIEILKESGRL